LFSGNTNDLDGDSNETGTDTMKPKILPTLDHERSLGAPEFVVAGVDEVGRGCLAGPVVAGAVILPRSFYESQVLPAELREVRDSKLLSPEKRERLAPWIREHVAAWAIGEASVQEIDQLNIYHASHLAMVRAVQGLKHKPALALIDGNALPKGLAPLGVRGQTLVKGDMKSLSIACASILAKVHRDALLDEYESRYPGYGFGAHKGYSTPGHQRALQALGAIEVHRRSFGPVAQVLVARS
jgi:ribonuclease HII